MRRTRQALEQKHQSTSCLYVTGGAGLNPAAQSGLSEISFYNENVPPCQRKLYLERLKGTIQPTPPLKMKDPQCRALAWGHPPRDKDKTRTQMHWLPIRCSFYPSTFSLSAGSGCHPCCVFRPSYWFILGLTDKERTFQRCCDSQCHCLHICITCQRPQLSSGVAGVSNVKVIVWDRLALGLWFIFWMHYLYPHWCICAAPS